MVQALTPAGKLGSLNLDASGALIVTGIAGGGGGGGGGDASAANQVTGNTSLASLDTKATAHNTKLDTLHTDLGTTNTNTGGTKTNTDALVARTPTLGKKSVSGGVPASAKSGGDEYETVAQSQSDQVIGATGAVGDYLEGILCVVDTPATSQVQIKDGSGSAITILPNAVGFGVGTVYIPLGLTSTSGAWKVTTGAGVSCIAMGDFT